MHPVSLKTKKASQNKVSAVTVQSIALKPLRLGRLSSLCIQRNKNTLKDKAVTVKLLQS